MKFKNQLFPVIICPAWIPELNSVEHGPEGNRGWALLEPTEGLGSWRWVVQRMVAILLHLLFQESPCTGEADTLTVLLH